MSAYPRVLIVALGRINEKDTYNNGLFLRNVFGSEWPRENLAQIYSSGDSGGCGFFGRYYCLGERDRVLGKLFYRLKPAVQRDVKGVRVDSNKKKIQSIFPGFKRNLKSIFVDTGLYELLFRPKLSNEMLAWVNEFNPDIILAQGYNLTFTWLPLKLKRETRAKLAVLTTDDWPTYLYSGVLGESTMFRWLIRPVVKRAAMALFTAADIPLAFGAPMAEEYRTRYRREFLVINHSDDPDRFILATPRRVNEGGLTIMAIGTFNQFRLPLLLDANSACQELNRGGLNVRLVVLSSFIDQEGREALISSKYIDVFPDPGNDELPGYLKGADAFLLAEGFDPGFVSAIKLSISTKAHLFMFSQKPIVVYADKETGISQYAQQFGWAAIITNRGTKELVEKFRAILTDQTYSKSLVDRGLSVAGEFHTYTANQARFISALSSIY